jgi:hypothetical protein
VLRRNGLPSARGYEFLRPPFFVTRLTAGLFFRLDFFAATFFAMLNAPFGV